MLAEKELVIDILNEVVKGKFDPQTLPLCCAHGGGEVPGIRTLRVQSPGADRSAFREKKTDMGFEEARLRPVLRAIAVKHPAWGWRKARWHLLARPEWDGVVLNGKRVRRLWRDEGLVCKPRTRKSAGSGPAPGSRSASPQLSGQVGNNVGH